MLELRDDGAPAERDRRHLVRSGGDDLGGLAVRGRPRPTAVFHLLVPPQQAVDSALRGHVDAFVGQQGDDLLRRQVAEARRVHDAEDASLFGLGELVGGPRLRPCSAVFADALLAPALQGPRRHAELFASSGLTGAGLHGFVDEAEDQVSFVGRVLSSPSPQIAWTFF